MAHVEISQRFSRVTTDITQFGLPGHKPRNTTCPPLKLELEGQQSSYASNFYFSGL